MLWEDTQVGTQQILSKMQSAWLANCYQFAEADAAEAELIKAVENASKKKIGLIYLSEA